MRAAFVVALCLIACKDNPSPLDHAIGSAARRAAMTHGPPRSARRRTDTARAVNTAAGSAVRPARHAREASKTRSTRPGRTSHRSRSKDFDDGQAALGRDGRRRRRRRARGVLAHRRRQRHRAAQPRRSAARAREERPAHRAWSCASSRCRISLPDLVELRAAMHDFRAAGKQLHCHTEDAIERDVPRARRVRPHRPRAARRHRDHRPVGDADPRQAAARQARDRRPTSSTSARTRAPPSR